jgi:hypothetical protein
MVQSAFMVSLLQFNAAQDPPGSGGMKEAAFAKHGARQ